MSTMVSQVGVKDESTYGTPVTVDKFYEFNSFNVKPDIGRVESMGLRASGGRVMRADRSEPYVIGASGDVVFDVPTKGFGWWLKHMLGTVATGSVTDSNYTHTGTIGSLLGDFFTLQASKPFNPAGTAQPFTFHGCKVTNWGLACDLDGVLVATVGVDAEDHDTSTSLASASYPADFRVFTFAGASLTIGGSSVEVRNIEVTCDNALNTDRRFLRTSALKKEPVENGRRQIEFSCEADWSDLTHFNRFAASTRANMYAAVVATFVGPIAHGGTTLPQLQITMPAVRFDAVDADISGPEALTQAISGVAHNTVSATTDDAVSITYRTTDATP